MPSALKRVSLRERRRGLRALPSSESERNSIAVPPEAPSRAVGPTDAGRLPKHEKRGRRISTKKNRGSGEPAKAEPVRDLEGDKTTEEKTKKWYRRFLEGATAYSRGGHLSGRPLDEVKV